MRFLQVAELRLRTQKRVALAHLCYWHSAKNDFRGNKLKQKTPPFLFYITLNDYCSVQSGGRMKCEKRFQRDILKEIPID
jgi:hypothetical protein